MKLALFIILAGFGLAVAACPASAQTTAFRLDGYHASPLMREWAVESQMPAPPVPVWINFGDAMYSYGTDTIYLPSCCREGWTHLAIRGLLFHELGHVYDHTSMTPTLRAEFRQTVGVPLGWNWWAPIRTVRWVVNDHSYIRIAPGEMFAEEYAACSLGLTQLQYQEAGYNTYGWVPPEGTDEPRLCDLIASATR